MQSFLLARCLEIVIYLTRDHFLLILVKYTVYNSSPPVCSQDCIACILKSGRNLKNFSYISLINKYVV